MTKKKGFFGQYKSLSKGQQVSVKITFLIFALGLAGLWVLFSEPSIDPSLAGAESDSSTRSAASVEPLREGRRDEDYAITVEDRQAEEAYQRQLKEEARKRGESYVAPLPLAGSESWIGENGTDQAQTDAPENQADPDLAEEELRAQIRAEMEAEAAAQKEASQVEGREARYRQLTPEQKQQFVQAKAQYMGKLVEAWSNRASESTVVNFNHPRKEARDKAAAEGREAQQARQASSAGAEGAVAGKRGLLPGDTLIGVLNLKIDSTEPSYLEVDIPVGPYKGMRLMGSWEQQGDALRGEVDTLTYGNHTTSIDGLVIHRENLSPNIAESVNYHRVYRWGLLIGGGVMEGFNELLSNNVQNSRTAFQDGQVIQEVDGLTTQQIVFGALTKPGFRIANIAQNEFDKPPTAITPADTVVGIKILSPLNEPWLPDSTGMEKF